PALDPPAGVVPNFQYPGGEHVIGYAIVVLYATLATLSFLLRCYSRVLMKKVHREDALLSLAYDVYIAHMYITYSLAVYPGFHVHQWNITVAGAVQILYNSYVIHALYCVYMMLIKPAILLDLLRLFFTNGQRNALFWISHVLIWLNIAFYSTSVFVAIFQCSPRARAWNFTLEGTCPINMKARLMTTGAINLVSDIAISILPQTVIWKLQLSRPRKNGVAILFGVGVFACACATARLCSLYQTLKTSDKMYTASETALWSGAGMTAGFLIVGVPSIPKVAKTLPCYERIRSKLHSKLRSDEIQSRLGLPSWYKPERRAPRNSLDISEIDQSEFELLQPKTCVRKPMMRVHHEPLAALHMKATELTGVPTPASTSFSA
ncbi:hypothetical protein K491DRAFT_611829, partial [Lophiostoma macrostomum CBS 122681]